MGPPDDRAPGEGFGDDVVVLDDTTDEIEIVEAVPVIADDQRVDAFAAGDDIEVLHDGDDIEVLDDDVSDVGAGDNDDVSDGGANRVVGIDGARVPPARRPVVDPRIRARRIAVAREQGRRRLRVVMVALSVVVVIGTAWLVVESPMLDVDHIVVTGIPQARVAAVVAATGVHLRDPLLLVSTASVERKVEAVPGIGSVHVERELPGTLHISARQQGVALWARAAAGGAALIGYDGRVQRIAPAPPAGVIELRDLAHVPAPGGRIPMTRVVDVMAALPEALRIRIGAISATSSDDVRLYLIVGGQIRLGDLSSLHDKGVTAESVLVRMGCAIDYVDVGSISNPVARPAPGVTCNP